MQVLDIHQEIQESRKREDADVLKNKRTGGRTSYWGNSSEAKFLSVTGPNLPDDDFSNDAKNGGWLRNPAPGWFIQSFIGLQASVWWCGISQPSTVVNTSFSARSVQVGDVERCWISPTQILWLHAQTF